MYEDARTYERIMDFARRDANIAVAILNGSRANKNAPADFLRDFDVCMFVDDYERAQNYIRDWSWMHAFGELVLVQQNNGEDWFIFLMQFFDGTRVDLSFQPLHTLRDSLRDDSLSLVLLDKRGLIDSPPVPDESSYYVTRPTRAQWDETLNELWWIQPYVAKELWRAELPLAKELYDEYLMKALRELVSWHIGHAHDYKVNVGHGCKWFSRLLPAELYELFLSCYSSAEPEEQWDKLLRVGAFIRRVGEPLSRALGYDYPYEYDRNVRQYLRMMKALPPGAERMGPREKEQA